MGNTGNWGIPCGIRGSRTGLLFVAIAVSACTHSNSNVSQKVVESQRRASEGHELSVKSWPIFQKSLTRLQRDVPLVKAEESWFQVYTDIIEKSKTLQVQGMVDSEWKWGFFEKSPAHSWIEVRGVRYPSGKVTLEVWAKRTKVQERGKPLFTGIFDPREGLTRADFVLTRTQSMSTPCSWNRGVLECLWLPLKGKVAVRDLAVTAQHVFWVKAG